MIYHISNHSFHAFSKQCQRKQIWPIWLRQNCGQCRKINKQWTKSIISGGDHDTSAYYISGHSSHVFSRKCCETSQDGQTMTNVVSPLHLTLLVRTINIPPWQPLVTQLLHVIWPLQKWSIPGKFTGLREKNTHILCMSACQDLSQLTVWLISNLSNNRLFQNNPCKFFQNTVCLRNFTNNMEIWTPTLPWIIQHLSPLTCKTRKKKFKCILLNENEWILPRISLKFVPKVRINNYPALVQIMAWHRPSDKPLSEPMMVSLLTHICVTQPQWVNPFYIGLLLWNVTRFPGII